MNLIEVVFDPVKNYEYYYLIQYNQSNTDVLCKSFSFK